jgi:hypothetical protein
MVQFREPTALIGHLKGRMNASILCLRRIALTLLATLVLHPLTNPFLIKLPDPHFLQQFVVIARFHDHILPFLDPLSVFS